jgi:hypothetical protein
LISWGSTTELTSGLDSGDACLDLLFKGVTQLVLISVAYMETNDYWLTKIKRKGIKPLHPIFILNPIAMICSTTRHD